MSAKRAGTDSGERAADDWTDPYGIIPESFKRRYSDIDTAAEALAIAKQTASNTDPAEFERCPACLSTNTRKKNGSKDMAHERDEPHKCIECRTHFETPLPPLVEARERAEHAPDTDRECERPRCRDCLSTNLYPKPDGSPGPETAWACLDCRSHFEAALPSYNATVRGEATRAERERIGELLRGGSDA